MFPHTDREGETSRAGARSSSSSIDKDDKSLKSSGEVSEEGRERRKEVSTIDSEGGSSEDLD